MPGTGVISTGSFARSLWPGVNAWFGERYKEWSTEYTELFDMVTAKYREEQDVLFSGFGVVPIKSEGGPISFDTAEQGFVTRFL